MAESLSWGPFGPLSPILPVPVDEPGAPRREPGKWERRSLLLARVAELADAQRSGAAALRDAAKAANEAGVSWRQLAEAAEMNHVTLFQQVQAGSPVVVVKPTHGRRGEK